MSVTKLDKENNVRTLIYLVRLWELWELWELIFEESKKIQK